MVKITNRQALMMFSPAMEEALNYPYPIAAKHLLVVGVEKIRREFKQVPKANDEILNKYGTVDQETGAVNYETDEARETAMVELDAMLDIERDVNVKQVKVADSFPDVAGHHLRLLLPLLKEDDADK